MYHDPRCCWGIYSGTSKTLEIIVTTYGIKNRSVILEDCFFFNTCENPQAMNALILVIPYIEIYPRKIASTTNIGKICIIFLGNRVTNSSWFAFPLAFQFPQCQASPDQPAVDLPTIQAFHLLDNSFEMLLGNMGMDIKLPSKAIC